jgi:hypothetical protein
VIEVNRLVEAIATGETISPNIGDVVQVARLIEAVQRGGWVDMELGRRGADQAISRPGEDA